MPRSYSIGLPQALQNPVQFRLIRKLTPTSPA
jgi:hypothetical protein